VFNQKFYLKTQANIDYISVAGANLRHTIEGPTTALSHQEQQQCPLHRTYPNWSSQ